MSRALSSSRPRRGREEECLLLPPFRLHPHHRPVIQEDRPALRQSTNPLLALLNPLTAGIILTLFDILHLLELSTFQDQDKFFSDFAAVFQKLTELGVPTKQFAGEPWQMSTLDELADQQKK